MLQQATILAYGCLVFGLRIASLPLLAATIGVWSATLTALGAMARNSGALSAMVNVCSLTVTGLGGAFVPLSLLPA